MNKRRLVSILTSIKDEVEELFRILRSQRTNTPVGREYLNRNIAVSQLWFDEVTPVLSGFDVSDNSIIEFNTRFENLTELSLNRSSTRTQITEQLLLVVSTFVSEIFIPVFRFSSFRLRTHHIEEIMQLVSVEERDYLEEALDCAQSGYFRSAVILGWCAAVYRMHVVIERIGFERWNETVVQMRGNTGVPRAFRNIPEINTIIELRRKINEYQLLWVLECLSLIDPSQHDRLQICLTTRNTASHPGEVFTSEDNVVSFFSDLRYHLFLNSNFDIQ